MYSALGHSLQTICKKILPKVRSCHQVRSADPPSKKNRNLAKGTVHTGSTGLLEVIITYKEKLSHIFFILVT